MAAAQRQRPGAGASFWPRTRRCGTCTTRACRRIRSTSWRSGRCAASAACSSFDLGSLEAARRFLNGVRLLALAESLGGVETLISHPATMTHASVPAERRAALGITDGLVRISVGIEDIEDLEGRPRAGARSASEPLLAVLDFIPPQRQAPARVRPHLRVVGYGLLFAIVFAETGFVVTPFLPGDSLLFATGALCATGALSTPAASGCWSLAAFTGNAVNYAVGRIVGPRVFARDGSVGHLAPAAQPRAPAAGARVLRAVRRQGRHPRPLRADRPHVRAVRGRRRADDVARVRVLQPDRRGGVGGPVRRGRTAVRQRAVVKENFSLVTIGIVFVSLAADDRRVRSPPPEERDEETARPQSRARARTLSFVTSASAGPCLRRRSSSGRPELPRSTDSTRNSGSS